MSSMSRDSSIAPLLLLRRRLKVVMELADVMIRSGVSLSRSVELSVQWDKILSVGPLFPVTFADFEGLLGVGLVDFSYGVCCIHRRLCDFIHSVVVHRRDEAIRSWRNWIRGGPSCASVTSGFGLIWFPLPHFSSVILVFHLVVLVFFLILLGLMRNSVRPGFPIFAALGKGRPALWKSMKRLRGGCPCYQRFSLPSLTGQMLADVVQGKGATAGSLDGWSWRELKVLPVSWYDGLARILTAVENTGGLGLMVFWMLTLP